MNSFVDVSQVDIERDEALDFVDDLESNEMSASDFDDVERSWNTEDVLGFQESTGALERFWGNADDFGHVCAVFVS